jgi:hypothetical protein
MKPYITSPSSGSHKKFRYFAKSRASRLVSLPPYSVLDKSFLMNIQQNSRWNKHGDLRSI